MRAKIKELLTEAGGMCYGNDGEELPPVVAGESVEYLIDLVINECITAVKEVRKFPVTTYERDTFDARLVEQCVEAIKDRFK